ncbi:THAP domain-containing 2 [Paramuricea clavata]|uniref:THAP domain-containing 2 n=1 Tax=Paramuricea clavata TaxID=317549 RepID=A0A6S7KDP7_PARCT|nr:THAP domain-containing 2 [Paramuricea clavata]
MPKVCSIPHCGATTQNARDRSFHQFPQDSSLRTAWIKRVGRENFQPSSNSSICSHHFGDEHFRQPNNETPAQFRKATLKPGSLPTYNLLDFSESFALTSSRSNNLPEGEAGRDIGAKPKAKAKKRFRRRKPPKSDRFKATSTKNRTLTPELKERIEKNKVSFCELHFKHDCILENPTRKGLVTGSVPTENLPMFRGRPRELQLFKPPDIILILSEIPTGLCYRSLVTVSVHQQNLPREDYSKAAHTMDTSSEDRRGLIQRSFVGP